MTKEPMTPLGESAVQMHELMLEYERAGFTRAEAVHIVLELLKNAANNPNKDSE